MYVKHSSLGINQMFILEKREINILGCHSEESKLRTQVQTILYELLSPATPDEGHFRSIWFYIIFVAKIILFITALLEGFHGVLEEHLNVFH